MSLYTSDIVIEGNKLGHDVTESIVRLGNSVTLSGEGIILDTEDELTQVNIEQILSSRHLVLNGSAVTARYDCSLVLSGRQLNVSTLYGFTVIESQQDLGGPGSHIGIVSYWSADYDETAKEVTLNAPIGERTQTTTPYLVSLHGHNHDLRYYIEGNTIHLGENSLTPSITGLAGVEIVDPVSGQILVYNGSKWVNVDAGEGGGSLFIVDGNDVKPKDNRNIKTPVYFCIGSFKIEEETIEASGVTTKRLKISRTDDSTIPADMYSTGGLSAYGIGSGNPGGGGDSFWMQDPTDGRLHAQLRAVLTGGTATEDGDVILYAARGAANGVASLDANGKVPSSQAPASIIEGYYYLGVFYSNPSHTSVITGEVGRLYVDITNESASALYRWTGTEYSLVGSGTVIGAKITSDGNPLTVDSGYIIFPYAAANVDGAVSSSEQYFTGIKHIDDGIQIGPIKIIYDSVFSALRFEHATSGSLANIYATGAVSSYGDGPGGGGGGVSYLYQLSDVQDYRTSYRGKLLKSKDDGSGVEWVDVPNSAVWGNISGTLSDQPDLQAALDAKVSANDPITSAQKCKITYDSKGLVTAGTDLVLTDMPQEIQTLYADFNDMFRKVTSGSDFIIEAKKDMYSVGGLSAYGNGQGGSGGAGYLYQLSDVPDYRALSNKVLKVNSSHSLVWSDESSGGANVQWGTESSDTVPLSVDGVTKTLIMSHQSLSNYYTKTEMDTALSNKASTDHTHTLSNITDFTISALNGLTAPTHFVFCTSYPSYQPSDTIYFKVEAV